MQTPIHYLKKYWGYDEFRPLQGDIIDSVLRGKDTLALLATGAGKSLCYQLPSLILKGKTVVISPLIALMQDQVSALRAKGIYAKAVYAGMPFREIDLVLDNFMNGPMQILFVSPERLKTDIFIERFKKSNVSLIAVDEAHCISQWGHDFRPAYFEIAILREHKPEVPILALTATATDRVIDDIIQKLEMRDPALFKNSFKRDNLSIKVVFTEEKFDHLKAVLEKNRGSAIIYQRSRSNVKTLSEELIKIRGSVDYYHGGLPLKTRVKIQQDWISRNDGIIICTNAFGMGVDKPDVRLVIHYDIPPTIEEYYQEVGRAGRDGKPAEGLMIVNFGDVVRLRKLHLLSYPDLDFIRTLYDRIGRYAKIAVGGGAGQSFDFDIDKFALRYKYSVAQVYSVLSILEKEGWLYLNEALIKPSKVCITTSRADIRFSMRNRDLKAAILIFLLRKYEGIYIDFVTIDEGLIANELGVKREDIHRQLIIMSRESILSYKPASENPEITLIHDRVSLENFSMDQKAYLHRKKTAYDKMSMMQALVIGKNCRQQAILSYFGEESSPCGHCDVCMSTYEIFTREEKEKLYSHIKSKAISGKINLDYYLRLWPNEKKGKAMACILDLESEGRLSIDGNLVNISKDEDQ